MAAAPSYFRFEIHAERCPQLLARIVGLFAAGDILPTDLHVRRSVAGLWAGIEAPLTPDQAERLAQKLRVTIGVAWVLVMQLPCPRPPHRAILDAAASAQDHQKPSPRGAESPGAQLSTYYGRPAHPDSRLRGNGDLVSA
jgi:hypothetical protein